MRKVSPIEQERQLTRAKFARADGEQFNTFADAAFGQELTVRPKSVVEFFANGELWGDRTLFNEVKFCGAERRVIYQPINKLSMKSQVKLLANSLQSVMNDEYFDNDLNHGVFLSGGLDSRAVLAAAPEGLIKEAYTFGDKRSDDVLIAKQVAKVVGIKKHLLFDIKPDKLPGYYNDVIESTGGMWGVSQAYSMPIMEEVGSRVDVALDGFGTDAMLGGNVLLVANTPEKYLETRRLFSTEELTKLLAPKIRASIGNTVAHIHRHELRNLKSLEMLDRVDELSMSTHVAANNIGYVAPRQFYETFSPQAHPKFVDDVIGVPSFMRAFHRVYAPLIKELSPEAARLPYAAEMFAPTAPWPLRVAGRLAVSARRKANRIVKLPNANDYLDMRAWWKSSPRWRQSIICAANLDNKWLNRDYIDCLVSGQENGEDNITKLMHIATFKLACERFES